MSCVHIWRPFHAINQYLRKQTASLRKQCGGFEFYIEKAKIVEQKISEAL